MEEKKTIAAAAEQVGGPNLGSINDVLFTELNNVLKVDMSDPDAVEREISRAHAVTQLAGMAIDNANTALRVVQVRDGLMDAKAKMPHMLTAGA